MNAQFSFLSIFLAIAAVAALALLVGACLYCLAKSVSRFRRGRIISGAVLLAPSLLVAYIFGSILFAFLPGGDSIIARVKTRQGVELCLIQTSNYSAEPYTVSFYYKAPGKHWGWFYYDHQDTRWWAGSIELSPAEDRAVIKRGSRIVATFDIQEETFIRRGRTDTCGDWMPEEWTPESAVRRDD